MDSLDAQWPLLSLSDGERWAAPLWVHTLGGLLALSERLHGLRWRDLRHTCASPSLSVEPRPRILKKRRGHTAITIYGHLLPEADQALAAGLAAEYGSSAIPPRVLARSPGVDGSRGLLRDLSAPAD